MFKSHRNYQQQALQPPPSPKVNLKDALTQLIINTSQFMAKTNATLQSQATSIKNLEIQMGQIANVLNLRLLRALPSDIKRNLKVHIATITLRNCKELK